MSGSIIVGHNEAGHCVSGWHAREVDSRCAIPYRAADGRGVLRLPVTGRTLNLLLSGAWGLRQQHLRGELELPWGRVPLGLDGDLWVLRSVAVPAEVATGSELDVVFHMDDPPCPGTLVGNGDGRRLGWFLSASWWSNP